jgi:hypothetical protein
MALKSPGSPATKAKARMSGKASSIDAYLAKVTGPKRSALDDLRKLLRARIAE